MAPTRRDEKPKAGDCIEIFRGNYQHWALDVGDGCVVHLAPPCEAPGGAANKMVSVLCEKALVQKNGLWDVVGNHEWRVNNDLDKKYEHRPVQVIVRDALDVVGCELPYNVVTRNCEHFVNELRYGKAESRQVRQYRDVAIGVGVAAVVTWGVVALAKMWLSDNKEEEEEEEY
ncbi:retinoic acid receptor responder protein 3-like [Gouania willdenowi]|uniref:retinoic acid receptor responder protein 3-like n=1 Tax=Gouania willdenowi TaxID=441366 RepID=UPI001055ADC8|nr:retinoic acid receptor responder protein 3-like [Gouania willdenowi]XP_028314543.1 retinoic acid receptor responder protein 3-like [Gouania willdenowi]